MVSNGGCGGVEMEGGGMREMERWAIVAFEGLARQHQRHNQDGMPGKKTGKYFSRLHFKRRVASASVESNPSHDRNYFLDLD